jgi:hypothetical protein
MSKTTIPKPGLKPMLEAYIECALWASTHFEDENDANGTPMDQVDAELSDKARTQMESDCANFMDCCAEMIGDEWHAGQTFEQIGHDFWLTRNGHGAGFWDRGLGELGDKLSDAAKTFGSCDLYVGDDGMIYAS